MFCQENGQPYEPRTYQDLFKRCVRQAGIADANLHCLRHSNATALIQAGVSPKVVQQRLGHSDVNITLNTYTHALPEMDQEAAQKIDQLLFAQSGR